MSLLLPKMLSQITGRTIGRDLRRRIMILYNYLFEIQTIRTGDIVRDYL